MTHLNKGKDGKSMTSKIRRLIAPGALGKERRNMAMRPNNSMGASNGPFTTHDLIVHYDEAEHIEKDFSEESCFLDLLQVCKKFLDIYTVGFKITDGDGRPLKDDRDVLLMIEECKWLKDVHIFLEKDETSQPLTFRMPQDNQNFDSHALVKPKVTNVKISGSLKHKKKVVVKGDVIDGSEMISIAQLFILVSKEFDNEDDLEPISQPKTDQKEFRLSEEAIDHYLVAKYTPIATNGEIGDPVYVISDKCVESSEQRQVRGKNKNLAVANLKRGEKYPIEFEDNRGAGPYGKYWSRHLGKLVRDPNMCPVRVQTWKDVSQIEKNNMWSAVKECFFNPDIELYKKHTLEHMDILWTRWRSEMNRENVKKSKSVADAIKNVPKEVQPSDWEWLVKNKYLSEQFKQASERNSINRAKGNKMPHHTGSRPFRDLKLELGSKDGNPPTIDEMFFHTRKKGGKLVEQEAQNKYDEIVKAMKSHPSLTNLEVIEKCFGPQCHSNVFGYGGGIKRKHMKESNSPYVKELEARLLEKDEVNQKLQKTIESVLSRLDKIEKKGFEPSPVAHSNVNEESNQDGA